MRPFVPGSRTRRIELDISENREVYCLRESGVRMVTLVETSMDHQCAPQSAGPATRVASVRESPRLGVERQCRLEDR
jgi:hypothetical protein